MRQHFFGKVISIMLTVAMLASFIPASLVSAATPSQFTDFPTGWSKPAMTAAVNNGLLQGKTDTTIEPQSYLTRAEMATIINRAFGAYLKADITNYTDVPKNIWYYDQMAIAVNMQTFEGNGSDKLYPENNITREEVFAVVARALVYDTKDYSALSRFNDGALVSDWAKPYVSALAARGYINGDETGNLYPQAYITREEFAQIMHNIIKTYISAPGDYNKVAEGGVMIRCEGVNLKGVNISGDLVVGDGVGYNNLELSQVNVDGRMIVRAGNITLKDTTTGMKIAVKNVNGVVHFNNYKTEKVFDGIDERTHTTYLATSGGVSFGGGGGGGGGGGSTAPSKYKYTVKYYFQKADLSDSYEINEAYTKSATVEKNTQVTAETPEIENFTLNNEKSASAFNAVIGQNDKVLKVYYNRDYYTLTFNYNYSGAPTASTVKTAKGYSLGEFDKMPVVVDRESHKFIGWSTDALATTPDFTGDTVATSDKTLYAVWEIKKFDLTFKYDDGVTADGFVEDVEWGTEFGTIKPATDPERADYYFGGWYTEPNGQGDRYNDDTPISADAEMYAYWTPIPTYIITFKYDDDGITADFEAADVPENTLFGTVKPADPTREDYDFNGWYTEEDGQGTKYDDDTPVTADAVVYAYWTLKPVIPVTYTVTFNYNYINAPADDTVPGISYNTLFGSVITDEIRNKIVNRDENGVVMCFRGWNTSPDGNGAWYTDTKKITRDITLYAMWEETDVPTTYTVTFNFNYKATWANADVNNIAYGTEFATAKAQIATTLNGYIAEVAGEKEFKGWNTEADGTGTMYADNTPITGDIELYAIWADVTEETTYTVTFNFNYKATWNNEDVDGIAYGEEFATVKAQIETVLNGYIAEVDGEKVFKGWNTKADGTGTMYTDTTPITGGIELYAIWADAIADTTYTVTFNYNYKPEWTNVLAKNVVYGSEFKNVIPSEVSLSLEAYKNELFNIKAFKGWNTKADGTGAMYGESSKITDNITLFAIWADIDAATTYTVTFDYNYDPLWTAFDKTGVVYGSDFADVLPNEVIVALDTYRTQLLNIKAFKGWNTKADGTGAMYVDDTTIKGNTVLYAIWADIDPATTYTVTFDYNYDVSWTDGLAEDVVYGSDFKDIIPQEVKDDLADYIAELDGEKEFRGWNNLEDGTGTMYTDTTKITGNTVLYAIWADALAPTTYTVTLKYNHNHTDSTPDYVKDEIVYGTELGDIIIQNVLDNLVSHEANGVTMCFKGWNTETDGTGIWYEDTTKITKDLVLYAIWEEEAVATKYTVIFKFNEKPEWPDDEATDIVYSTLFKDIIPASVTTALDSYILELAEDKEFRGWNTKADGTGIWYEDDTRITDDVILYAIWEPIVKYTVTFKYNYTGAPDDALKERILFGTLIKDIVTDDIKANIVDRTEGELLFGFKGWNTKKDGTGTWYEDETPVTTDEVLYAIWYDKSTYYTVKFYYGYAETDEYKEYIKVSEEDDVLAGSTYEQGVVTQMYIDAGYDEDMYLMQDGYYDAEFNSFHKIPGQLRYLDGTQWREFKVDDPSTPDVNEGTPITGNMEIHYTFANLGLFGEVNAFGINDYVTLTVPYSSSTRIMDTLKDFLWINRNAVETAVVSNGLEQRVLDKAEEKGGKLIDANGNIKVVDFDLLISRVIAPEDIDKKAQEYLENIIRTGTQEEIKNMLGMVNINSFIKSIGLKKLIAIVGYDTVKNELVEPAVREQLIVFIRELINTDEEFRNDVINKVVVDKEIVKSYLDKNEAKEKVINEITTNEILIDHMLANDDLKNMLVERMKDDNTFLSTILDNSSMHDKVVGILRNQEKASFIDKLNNSHALRESIIDDIKGDGTAVPQIITDSMYLIIPEVKQTQDFKDVLTTDNDTRNDIVSTVKASTEFKNVLKNVTDNTNIAIVNEVLNSQAFKNILTNTADATNIQVVNEVLGSQAFKNILTDRTDATNINIVRTVKNSSVFDTTLTTDNATRDNIINQLMSEIIFDPALHITDSQKKDYIIELMGKYVNGSLQSEDAEAYGKVDAEADEAIIKLLADYANGTISDVSLEAEITAQAKVQIQSMLADYANGTISDVSLEAEITAQAKEQIQSMLSDYADGALTGDIANKISEQADVKIKGYLADYANGISINASVESKIEEKVSAVIEDSVEQYFTDVNNMKPEIKDVVDSYVETWIVDTITDYLNDTMTNPAIEADVESEIFHYIKEYLNGTLEFTDADAQQFVEDVKVHFIEILKDEPSSTLEEPVENYLMNPANYGKVSEMVLNNYAIVEEYIIDNLTTDDQVVTFVRQYIETNIYTIDDDIMNEFIDKYFYDFVDNEMIDKFVDKYENDDDVYELLSGIMNAETVAKHIVKTREDDALNGTNNTKTLVDQAINMLENLEYYKEFMDCFKNGDATYHVDKENILFVEAVGHGIHTFDFNELVEILREKGFGKIIDTIGTEKFEEIFNESKDEYYNGILDMKAQIEADETKEFEYKASMWVRIDPMDIVKSLFDDHKQKLYNKVSKVDRARYDENPYLKQFVEQDLFAEFFNYDASMKDNVYTGYSIKTFMDYYDVMYERILLADKALCWYGELPADEHAELESFVMNGIVKAINKAIEIINKLDNDEEIFRGYTVEELADKYNRTSKLFDRFEDKYRKALDKFANSNFNRTYDRSYIESKYAPYNIADIVTGIDTENRFYVDTVYNMIGTRLNRFKLEYVENEYSGRYAVDKYGKGFRDNMFSISRYID